MINIKVLASGSSGNCYWITDGKTPLLLDAGIKLKDIQEGTGFRLSEVEGCLITHEHLDHAKAVKDLTKMGINIYITQGTIDALEIKGHRLKVINAEQQYEIGSWIVKPLKAVHNAKEPVNFLIYSKLTKDKLVYITDTRYTPYRFSGLTYIMIECNYSIEILEENIKKNKIPAVMKKMVLSNHFGLRNVKEFLRTTDLKSVKEIYLLHLSDGNSNAEEFKNVIQGLTGKPVYIA